jgi:hypothetical protein
MPKGVDPSSRAGQLLALLKSTPDQAWTIKALAEAVGIGTSLAAQTLVGATRSSAEGSLWRHVVRLSRGVWVYSEHAPEEQIVSWKPVWQDGDVVVFRGPDGAMWIARPLPVT